MMTRRIALIAVVVVLVIPAIGCGTDEEVAVHYEIERISPDYTPLVIVALWDSEVPTKVDDSPLEGSGEGVVTFSAPYAAKYYLKVSGSNAVYAVTAVKD